MLLWVILLFIIGRIVWRQLQGHNTPQDLSPRSITQNRPRREIFVLEVDATSSILLCPTPQPKLKPYFLLLDTETADAIEEHTNTVPTHDNPPIALSWALLSEQGELIQEHSYLLKQSISVTDKGTEIHRITTEQLHQQGKTPKHIYQALLSDSRKVKVIVAHNLPFHLSILQRNMEHYGLPSGDMEHPHCICTMEWGKQLGFKCTHEGLALYPKLRELFAHLYFGRLEVPIHYNNKSLCDLRLVTACLRCLLGRENQPK